MLDEIDTLENRLKDVIVYTCNKIGCENCGLSWTENGKEKCSATELQGKIYDLKYNKGNKNV